MFTIYRKSDKKVFIVGAGNVGSTIAYSLGLMNLVNEINLIDTNQQLCEGQVKDLNDSSVYQLNPTNFKIGDYNQIRTNDIVIICAGVTHKSGSRLDLIDTNLKILDEIIKNLNEVKKNFWVLIVSNPVDILTSYAQRELNIKTSKIFGSGTYLDTGRLKLILAEEFNVSPNNVETIVIGEHGDSSVPVLSKTFINSQPLSNFRKLDESYYQEISDKVHKSAQKIIDCKGSTYYGIGMAVCNLVKFILKPNSSIVFPISVDSERTYNLKDVTLGLPAYLTSEGYVLAPQIDLNEYEINQIEESANILKKYL